MDSAIETIGYPRAALIGNPSDGFYGETVAFTFSDFSARVKLFPSEQIVLQTHTADAIEFSSLDHLVAETQAHGYSPSIALVQATVKKFRDHCSQMQSMNLYQGFYLQAESDIPYQVGIAGSSAIIVAVLRALMRHYKVPIEKPVLASLALSVETEELCIPGGLQDRVAQVYQGLVHMDFNKSYFHQQGYGQYKNLNPDTLPSLYIAWRLSSAEGSEVFHNNIRERFDNNDKEVLLAIEHWKKLTQEFLEGLNSQDVNAMQRAMDANFDQRAQIYQISSDNLEMIRIARECGASAKFAGSGGAIIGIYDHVEIYNTLQQRFADKNIQILKPKLVSHSDNESY